jgi:hypothetical protein
MKNKTYHNLEIQKLYETLLKTEDTRLKGLDLKAIAEIIIGLGYTSRRELTSQIFDKTLETLHSIYISWQEEAHGYMLYDPLHGEGPEGCRLFGKLQGMNRAGETIKNLKLEFES